jgi:hypothetical protein
MNYGPWAWQERIGLLLPGGQDKWWTIDTPASAESVRMGVLDAIRAYALPAIEQQLAQEPREG